jgi:xanthine dehydrogenase accessory factor
MNMYEIIGNYLDSDKTGAIATIVTKKGSGPRNVGAKMFVGEDGKIYGTIGGGSLEFNVYKEAMARMGEHSPHMIHIKMDSEEVVGKYMICGGNVDIFLEPVIKKYDKIYRHLGHIEKTDKNGILITQFNNEKFLKTIIEKNEDIFDSEINENTFGFEISEDEKEVFQKRLHDSKIYATGEILIETLNHLPTLYIFGAGHISQFIAKFAKIAGFYVVVTDDRAEFANKERFPEADEILVEPIPDVFNSLQFSGNEFVVIVTRGHQFDADVLRESLKRDIKYVGMIGSKRKVKMIFDHMKKCGFSEDIISNVYSPIGLSINAETPQEIAVSIVAELIMVRRG